MQAAGTASPTTVMHAVAAAPVMSSQQAARAVHPEPGFVAVPVPVPVPGAVAQVPLVWSDTSSELQLVGTFDVTMATHNPCSAPAAAQQAARVVQAGAAVEPPTPVEPHATKIPRSAVTEASVSVRIM